MFLQRLKFPKLTGYMLVANMSSKPTSSEVLTAYLTQCKEPPWTSYFVKVMCTTPV